MKVLQVGLYDQPGGIEACVMNYYRHIDTQKVRFDFIDMHNGLAFRDEIQKRGGQIYTIPTAKHPIKQYKLIKKIIKQHHYDIVHIHMLSAANSIPVLAAKSANAKLIVHAHNSGTPKGILRKTLHHLNKRHITKTANALWACSKQAGEWFFGNNASFSVIPNAIDIDKYKFNPSTRQKIRKQLSIADNTLVIGHVGRFEEQKNHTFLIDVFKEVHNQKPDSILLLIGDGKLRPKIQTKVDSLGLHDCVVFLGQKSNIEEYYSAMDIFVFPSKFEGLSVATIEAHVASLPCILTDTVSEEIQKLSNTSCLSLNAISPWVKTILATPAKRQKTTTQDEEPPYCIHSQARKIVIHYENVKKISILHVTGGLAFGGVETFIYNHFSNVNRGTYNLSIVSHEEPCPECQKRFEELGFQVFHVPSKHETFVGNIKSLYKLIKSIHPDIIHCHLTSSNYIALIIAKLCGVKNRISHAHLAYPQKTIMQKISCILTKHYATDFFACGETAAKYLYGRTKNVTIAHNAIDLKQFKFNQVARDTVRNRLHIKPSTVVYGNIGRLHHQKNQLFLLEIFDNIHQQQPDSKLLIIGSGDEYPKILQKVHNLKLTNHVIIIDSTPQISDYYNAMDIFILPSLYEGLGIVAIEAQVNGLGCFVSDTTAHEVKLTPNLHFLSLSNSAELWANAIINEPLAQRQSRGISSQFSSYDITRSSKNLDSYYVKLMEHNNV